MIEYPKATDFQRAKFVGTWGDSPVPIYDVPNMYALNQLVGYVKHINEAIYSSTWYIFHLFKSTFINFIYAFHNYVIDIIYFFQ